MGAKGGMPLSRYRFASVSSTLKNSVSLSMTAKNVPSL